MFGVGCGEDNPWRVGQACNPGGKLEPVHSGHLNVQENQIERRFISGGIGSLEPFPGVQCVFGALNLRVRFERCELVLEFFAAVLFVFND